MRFEYHKVACEGIGCLKCILYGAVRMNNLLPMVFSLQVLHLPALQLKNGIKKKKGASIETILAIAR